MSPKDLLGGAIVRGAALDGSLAAQEKAIERSQSGDDFADAPHETAIVADVISAAGLNPLAAVKVAAQANLTLPAAETALAWLVEHGRVVRLQRPIEFVARNALETAFVRLDAVMRERHANSPWRLGVSTSEAAKALNVAEPLALRLLSVLHEDGRVAVRAGMWHTPDFAPALTKSQRAFFEKALVVTADAPFMPSSYETVATNAAQSRDVREALDSLLAVGALVRVGDDLYRKSQIERAQAAIATRIGELGHATMAQLRDVLGTSRKYALPLMEYFDSLGFTTRDGDLRRLRKAK